jgi:hypothetical protein
MKIVEITEKRRNPDQNMRSGSGKYDLINFAEDNISDFDNWAVSMTVEPKLGINPKGAVSEDTPKGIYFYPLRYFMKMADRNEALPWADNFPYMQLFQYDRSGEMTKQTKVDPAKLKQVLLQYCPEEVIQQAIEEGDYDGTPYWFIYDCLSRLGKGDETNVIRWNKVLRDLGFTSVYDPGNGWIAHNEPTQGVVLDPRIIKQHKMFVNRNPTLQNRRYDIQGLADSIGWSSYFQRESQSQRVYNHPDEKKVRLDVAKSMLKQFLGKTDKEAKEMGYDQALKAAADKVIELLKSSNESITEASLGTVLSWPEVVNKINSAMKATGWNGKRQGENTFMFTTKGQETDDQWYIILIANQGKGMFTYALGTVEDGDPYLDDTFKGALPATEASVSELLNIVRDGFGLSESITTENFADGKVKGKSRPGRVKRAGASCKGSVTDLRAKAKKYGGEKGKMYHWCANMKGGK